jgi:hypothetical protein
MATLYEDRHVTCDEGGLTIHRYYFPTAGDKRVPYAKIRHVEERAMGRLTGQWRIWGMGLPLPPRRRPPEKDPRHRTRRRRLHSAHADA